MVERDRGWRCDTMAAASLVDEWFRYGFFYGVVIVCYSIEDGRNGARMSAMAATRFVDRLAETAYSSCMLW